MFVVWLHWAVFYTIDWNLYRTDYLQIYWAHNLLCILVSVSLVERHLFQRVSVFQVLDNYAYWIRVIEYWMIMHQLSRKFCFFYRRTNLLQFYSEGKVFFWYLCYALGVPLLLSITVFLVDSTELVQEHLRPGIGVEHCFFNSEIHVTQILFHINNIIFFILIDAFQKVDECPNFCSSIYRCSLLFWWTWYSSFWQQWKFHKHNKN